MVRIFAFLLCLALPSAVIAEVSVDLSVLTQQASKPVPMAVLGPSPDLQALKRKYQSYPFVGNTGAVDRSTVKNLAAQAPLPSSKPAKRKGVPKPPIKVVAEAAPIPAVELVVEEPMVEQPLVPATSPEPLTVIDVTEPVDLDITEQDDTLSPFSKPAPTPLEEDEKLDGERVTAIGYGGDDIRLNQAVITMMHDEFVPRMQAQPAKRVGLYAYASSEQRGERQARRLSLSRALELRSFLISAGISAERIDIFALGDQADGSFKDRVDIVLQD